MTGLSEFIHKHNVLSTMCAVTIAFSTGTMIRSLVSDILMPSLYSLFVRRVNGLNTAFEPISTMNVDNFIREFFSWIAVLIVTYILIGYAISWGITKIPI